MSGDPKPKVTLEDLLRLKREERPAPEFWARFDRDLRAKQLAALVEKRPWWQGLPAWTLNWRRIHLPLGATAALALTLVSLRDAQSPAEVGRESGVLATVSAGPSAESFAPMAVATPVAEPAALALETNFGLVASPAGQEQSPEVELRVAEAFLPAPESTLPAAAGLADPVPARFAGGKVLAALDAETHLGRGGMAARETRTPVVRGAAFEPLAQMSSPTEARRARFRSALATPVAKETVAQANDRLARSLSDERMNDAVRRFDAKADRLSLKF